MLSASRNVAFVLLAACALVSTGCNSNAKKMVGKWKITAFGDDKAEKGMGDGIDFILEFKSDGTGAMSLVATNAKTQELLGKGANGDLPTFKWSVSGDKLELTSSAKDGKSDGPFGKKEKGTAKIKFEGDTLTITPDEAGEKAVKLVRVK